MDPARPAPLRIYRAGPPAEAPSAGPAAPPARLLGARELLQRPGAKGNGRDLEPFSRGWFEELERKRYAAHGGWLRGALEFSRHAGESLLMMGPGLGSDALQYLRHGVEVTVAAGPADEPELVRRNLELRGQGCPVVPLPSAGELPFARWSFDLAYLNAVYTPPERMAEAAVELYRVLKPGGKLFALAPAHYNARFWENVLVPWRRWVGGSEPFTAAPAYTARALRRAFAPFRDHRVVQRHLRRSELPYLWRTLPLGALERVMGNVLVLRAFKPIEAALAPEARAEEPAA